MKKGKESDKNIGDNYVDNYIWGIKDFSKL